MFVQNIQLDCVADCLGHLAAVGIEPHSVGNDRARLLNFGSHQKRRPVNRVETQNIFANQMQRRPELSKADGALLLLISKTDRRNVIGQGIEPDVHCVSWIVRNRHAPTH